MRHRKSITLLVAVAVALLAPIAAWADDDDDDYGVTITSETIHREDSAEWLYSLSHSQCNAIPNKLGVITPDSDDRVAQITTKRRPNGSREVDVFDVVTGTATGAGSVSGSYTWIYENRAIYSIPAGDGPVTVSIRMVDRFRLVGNGFYSDKSFDWGWRFEAPSGSALNPGPEFDGLVFPDDTVHPTNVSHFKNYHTDPSALDCDPL